MGRRDPTTGHIGPSCVAFFDRVLERVESLPGVEAAAVTSVLPASSNFDQRGIDVEGRDYGPGENPNVDTYLVTPDYLRAMRVPLEGGRGFAATDGANAPLVALVSESMAKKYWPGEEAVGKRIRFDGEDAKETKPWRIVVGVVGDVRQYGLDTSPTPALYVPVAQFPVSSVTLVARTSSDPASLVGAIRDEVRAVDREQAVFAVATMDQVLAESVATRRFAMTLLGLFAALAVALAAVGIYGVISYSVTQSTYEIGVRMALGAQTADVVGLVMRQGAGLAIVGVAIGVGVSLAATRLMASLLFGVTATDPTTFAAAAALLTSVAALASYLPARRAARVDPIVALRAE